MKRSIFYIIIFFIFVNALYAQDNGDHQHSKKTIVINLANTVIFPTVEKDNLSLSGLPLFDYFSPAKNFADSGIEDTLSFEFKGHRYVLKYLPYAKEMLNYIGSLPDVDLVFIYDDASVDIRESICKAVAADVNVKVNRYFIYQNNELKDYLNDRVAASPNGDKDLIIINDGRSEYATTYDVYKGLKHRLINALNNYYKGDSSNANTFLNAEKYSEGATPSDLLHSILAQLYDDVQIKKGDVRGVYKDIWDEINAIYCRSAWITAVIEHIMLGTYQETNLDILNHTSKDQHYKGIKEGFKVLFSLDSDVESIDVEYIFSNLAELLKLVLSGEKEEALSFYKNTPSLHFKENSVFNDRKRVEFTANRIARMFPNAAPLIKPEATSDRNKTPQKKDDHRAEKVTTMTDIVKGKSEKVVTRPRESTENLRSASERVEQAYRSYLRTHLKETKEHVR